MERKVLGILALALVGVFAVSLVVAMPGHFYDGDAMSEAVEDGDYDAWRELMMDRFSEDNFEEMTRMHALRTEMFEAREAGDYETMEAFRESMHAGRMGYGMMGSRGGYSGCPFAN